MVYRLLPSPFDKKVKGEKLKRFEHEILILPDNIKIMYYVRERQCRNLFNDNKMKLIKT